MAGVSACINFCIGLLFCHLVHSSLATDTNATLCFWFPLAHGNVSFTLTINYTICPVCSTRQAAYQSYEPGSSMWCKIGYDRCGTEDEDDIQMVIPPGYDNGALEGYYAWLAFLSFTYAAQFHPELFGIGNVSRVYVDKRHQFICAEHDGQNSTIPQHHNISALYAVYYADQVDGGNWFHLEWLRPFFSSWFVLNISWFLRRTRASPVLAPVYQILRPTPQQPPGSWSSKISAASGIIGTLVRHRLRPLGSVLNAVTPLVPPSTSR
ncbi:GP3 protein [RtEi arterivirus]|uniref:GP3 protein n=1 Tax=RtEi arterivirus TaxID=2847273 RepID=A0A2H4MX27_9NIDO|nr:GP3 protein [Rodent arterivirus]ATP66639.1 GP3 protein [RtEi arterivirus]